MRVKDTIDFLGLWEMLNNENFNASNSTRLKVSLKRLIENEIKSVLCI